MNNFPVNSSDPALLEDVIGYLDAAAGESNHRAVLRQTLRQPIEAYREAYCARA